MMMADTPRFTCGEIVFAVIVGFIGMLGVNFIMGFIKGYRNGTSH